MNVPEQFKARMQRLLGEEYGQFIAVYGNPAVRGVRVNTLKAEAGDLLSAVPFSTDGSVPWCGEGFYTSEEKPGLYIEHAAGLYYVQEPSAMCAVPLFSDLAGKAVLDLCAAPGGKSTQLAARMRGSGILFCNEINFSRAKALSQNIERMGVKNACVTVAPPGRLSEIYPACFDCVLVDAPCSGEGMFRKEEGAAAEWSEANVEMCARRQAEILESADALLRAGGELVYSTCTFAPEEDELQIERFLARHADYTLVTMHKLMPHRVRGEGHFAALLKKLKGDSFDFPPAKGNVPKSCEKLWREFEERYLFVTFGNLFMAGETLYSLPENCPAPKLQTLRAGVRLGEFVKDRFEPSHSLAMCLKRGEAPFLELGRDEARAYLGGLTFGCDRRGWAVAAYNGHPLGWVKAGGGVAKNHLPKGLRFVYN